jgi:hypothetical protein
MHIATSKEHFAAVRATKKFRTYNAIGTKWDMPLYIKQET